MERVSVVIATHDRSHIVANAIESVLAQTYPSVEVVVVDDGSKDATQEVLRRHAGRIVSVRQENRGVSAARNAGIDASSSAWIAFLDDDDEYAPEKLAVQMEELARFPEAICHVVNASLEGVSTNDDLFRVRGIAPAAGAGLERSPISLMVRGGFFMQCAVVRRDALDASGRFDTAMNLFEDLDLQTRLAFLGPWKLSHRPLVRVLRRQDDGGNLSSALRDRPVEAFTCQVGIWERALARCPAGSQPHRDVAGRLAITRLALASALHSTGRTVEARPHLAALVREAPRLRSRLRAAAGLYGGALGRRLALGQDETTRR